MATADDGLSTTEGMVVVPRSLAAVVFSAVVLHLSDRTRADGGAITPEARTLLRDLHQAASGAVSGTSTPAPATVDTARVMGVAEAADVLGCNPRYVRRLCHAGRIPAQRIPGGWVIERTALDDYRHGRAPNGEPGHTPTDEPARRDRS
ncbi:helix-turn-helix domain-containing protein [Streptomyces liliifuscus]|uniref:Helix-turn-helix domain-containing protein n=1 Tax=Streptomyces liliifuscus TaxID=2797636 RepID=A0A7T7I8D7_9ACTN|nr:helix-turn-helix domain-containing protein [Streptomyces liliifuscus]QQM42817.1 helix-turn-helix domain-containing protein [Streptomyces liliifuscus]